MNSNSTMAVSHPLSWSTKGAGKIMRYRDDFSISFGDKHCFLEFLDGIEERAAWIYGPTNELEVISLQDHENVTAKMLAEGQEETEEILSDTMEHTGLGIFIDGKYYPVGSTAIRTLENRARISGYALADLKKDKLARIFNDCLEVTKGRALVRIHEGKIRAVHGGDESDYSILPMPELFEAASIYLEENYDCVKFLEGYFDHSITRASWEIQDKALLKTYKELLLQYGLDASNEMSASIRIHSSDVAVSGANIFCYLLNGKNEQPLLLGGSLKLPHKDNASIELFFNNLEQIYARYKEEVEGLEKLFHVYLNYPLNVIAAVMKKAEIPAMLRGRTIEYFRATHGTGRCNGYDIYCGICEAIFLAESSGTSSKALIDLEEKVSKCLRFRFQDYDMPGMVMN